MISCQPSEKNDTEELSAKDSNIQLIGDQGSQLPYLFKDQSGELYISWVEESDDSVVFFYSKWQLEGEWSGPTLITKGADWFVNWADYPMIATSTGENMLAHYLSKSGEGTYSYDVTYLNSDNGGDDWSEPKILHDDGKAVEHGFVSMLPYGDNFFVCWLDGRNTSMEAGQHGQMTLRAAVLSSTGEKLQEWQLDDRVCDCCQTGAVITPNGPVVIYRNRSDEEIRDIYITRLVNETWTEPVAIHDDNWEIMGCPVNGPRIAAKEEKLAIAWYTSSPYSRVNVVFSEDAGASFSEAIEVNQNESIGRVDIDWLDDNRVITTYMEGDTIKSAAIERSGVKKREILMLSSASRSSGFPQIQIINKQLVLAWTNKDKGQVNVKWVGL